MCTTVAPDYRAAAVPNHPATVQNSYNPSAERRPSVTDQRHRFVGALSLEPHLFHRGHEFLGTMFNDWKFSTVVTQFAEVSGPYNVTSITADQYGFVTVTWGNGAGFEVIDKNGQAQEGGGGDSFMLNTSVATIPSAVQ